MIALGAGQDRGVVLGCGSGGDFTLWEAVRQCGVREGAL